MFFLFNCIIYFLIGVWMRLMEIVILGPPDLTPLVTRIYSLALLVPGIAVGIRRMHDTGRSGWWILLPVVNLVFLCQDSQSGENAYGPNPKMA